MAVDGYLRRFIEYNNWANQGLIVFLARVPDETLDATAPGVYGSIRQTLDHLFTAEDNYFRSLSRQPRSPQRPAEPGLMVLAGYARESAANLERLVLPGPDTRLEFNDGLRSAATALTQLFMHGVEHRTQVGTILGTMGIEPPDLDAWAHGIFQGADDWPPDLGAMPEVLPTFPFELRSA